MELGLVFMGMDIWSMGYFGPFGEIRLNEGFPSFPSHLWRVVLWVCVFWWVPEKKNKEERIEENKSSLVRIKATTHV